MKDDLRSAFNLKILFFFGRGGILEYIKLHTFRVAIKKMASAGVRRGIRKSGRWVRGKGGGGGGSRKRKGRK